MNRVIIGVGSNIQPRENIARAREAIEKKCKILRSSTMRETEPVGDPHQPKFINGAFLIETPEDREELKVWLCEIERNLGRPDGPDRSGPRTIDLDILVWAGKIADPDVAQRDFLRSAILEVWPELKL